MKNLNSRLDVVVEIVTPKFQAIDQNAENSEEVAAGFFVYTALCILSDFRATLLSTFLPGRSPFRFA